MSQASSKLRAVAFDADFETPSLLEITDGAGLLDVVVFAAGAGCKREDGLDPAVTLFWVKGATLDGRTRMDEAVLSARLRGPPDDIG